MSEEIKTILSKYGDVWFADGKREGITQGITQGISQGILQGVSQGISQGKDRKARSTARALLAEHISVDTIARCTGLTKDEVLAID